MNAYKYLNKIISKSFFLIIPIFFIGCSNVKDLEMRVAKLETEVETIAGHKDKVTGKQINEELDWD